MVMDYSIRIPSTTERIALLESRCAKKTPLSALKDILFKPSGVTLKEFDPAKVAVRLREFSGEDKPSTLVKIAFTKTQTGYTDSTEELGRGETGALIGRARELGYEKWGEVSRVSTEYLLDFNGEAVNIFVQELDPIGTFIKIETKTQESLDKALELLSATASEKIEKNAAVLLAEKLNLL